MSKSYCLSFHIFTLFYNSYKPLHYFTFVVNNCQKKSLDVLICVTKCKAMSYKRVAFDEDWWSKVEDYLKENPEQGFSEKEAKQFVKMVINKEMNQDKEQQLEELRRLVEDLGSD